MHLQLRQLDGATLRRLRGPRRTQGLRAAQLLTRQRMRADRRTHNSSERTHHEKVAWRAPVAEWSAQRAGGRARPTWPEEPRSETALALATVKTAPGSPPASQPASQPDVPALSREPHSSRQAVLCRPVAGGPRRQQSRRVWRGRRLERVRSGCREGRTAQHPASHIARSDRAARIPACQCEDIPHLDIQPVVGATQEVSDTDAAAKRRADGLHRRCRHFLLGVFDFQIGVRGNGAVSRKQRLKTDSITRSGSLPWQAARPAMERWARLRTHCCPSCQLVCPLQHTPVLTALTFCCACKCK